MHIRQLTLPVSLCALFLAAPVFAEDCTLVGSGISYCQGNETLRASLEAPSYLAFNARSSAGPLAPYAVYVSERQGGALEGASTYHKERILDTSGDGTKVLRDDTIMLGGAKAHAVVIREPLSSAKDNLSALLTFPLNGAAVTLETIVFSDARESEKTVIEMLIEARDRVRVSQ